MRNQVLMTKKKKFRPKDYWEIIKNTGKQFQDTDPMTFSACIAFYTIFSLPAMLIIMVTAAGAIFGEEAITGQLYYQIDQLVGKAAAADIQKVVKNAALADTSTLMTIIGIGSLMFSATTVFISMQNALNIIWGVKSKPEKGFIKFIKDRVISFAMVISLGFMLAVSLVLETIVAVIGDYLRSLLQGFAVWIVEGINLLVSFGVLVFMFAMIFKILPDVRIKWKDVWVGGAVTAGLFVIGKAIIGIYMGQSTLGNTYGAAGSIIIMLVWVYYSSLILLTGAQFTRAYTLQAGRVIWPSKQAVKVRVVEEEKPAQPAV